MNLMVDQLVGIIIVLISSFHIWVNFCHLMVAFLAAWLCAAGLSSLLLSMSLPQDFIPCLLLFIHLLSTFLLKMPVTILLPAFMCNCETLTASEGLSRIRTVEMSFRMAVWV